MDEILPKMQNMTEICLKIAKYALKLKICSNG